MTRKLRGRIAALLILALSGTSGCFRAVSTSSVHPASLYVRQLCPGLTYEVLGEFSERWTGVGFLGQPLNSSPNLSAIVAKEVARLGGDGVADVRVSSNLFLFYALLYAQVHPRHRVSGKVIRYTSNQCRAAR